jgi:hypothetical protein
LGTSLGEPAVDEMLMKLFLKKVDLKDAARALEWAAGELAHRNVKDSVIEDLKTRQVSVHDAYVIGHTTALFELKALAKELHKRDREQQEKAEDTE